VGGIFNLVHECAHPQDSPAGRVEQALRIERVMQACRVEPLAAVPYVNGHGVLPDEKLNVNPLVG